MFASKNELFTRPSGYNISRSVRLRSSASAYFNRTPSVAGNSRTWTLSLWIKRGVLGSATIFYAGAASTSSDQTSMQFRSDDTLQVLQNNGATTVLNKITSAVYRDPSAWYHIVLTFDTSNATAEDRVRVYVNGVRVTSFSTNTNISLSGTTYVNDTGYVNRLYRDYTTTYVDGYLTEVNFIDGTALTPSSFGSTNAITGVWQPAKYTGTYGTNGFYLNFSDNSASTAATIGKDYSGNGNNWTPNNISVTAGTTYDSMLDVPTPYADGGNGRGNYAVMNPLDKGTNVSATDGNLTATISSTGGTILSSIGVSSGKWYWEMTRNGGTDCVIGIANSSASRTAYLGSDANGWGYIGGTGNKVNNGSSVAYGTAYATTIVIGVALDMDSGTVTFYRSNVSQGTAYSSLTGIIYAAFGTGNNTDSVYSNFGQRPFTYTPPSGYVALNTQNLPTPTISNGANYMAATLYTGTGATLAISNAVNSISFQPDWVWVKGRSGATDHALYDSVRGTTKDLVSNSTAAETTQATGLTAFGSAGFTVGALAKMNTNAATYVGWQWKAGTTSASNTDGSITSTVSVGATQGFSVVTYTGTGANATVGHGLGVAPKMIIVKQRSAVQSWPVYHTSIGSANVIYLDLTNASAASTAWQSTTPTPTVFSIGTSAATNTNAGTYVAYCFSEVAGYSKFGSYTGNGSTDGPFVFCGFRPRYLLVKASSGTNAATANWIVWDSSRDTYNKMTDYLSPNLSQAEATGPDIDFLSNGFKLRNSGTGTNESGTTYIYMAVAENPFKLSLAR